MSEVTKAVSALAKLIMESAKDAVKDGSFDKTFFGVITGIDSGRYVVTSAGQDYTVRSSQYFTLGERVAITAMQNNYNTLILHKL